MSVRITMSSFFIRSGHSMVTTYWLWCSPIYLVNHFGFGSLWKLTYKQVVNAPCLLHYSSESSWKVFNLNITTTPLVHAVAVCDCGILCGPRVEFTNFECILYQFWFYFAVPVWAVITIIVAILLVIIVISVCICIKCCCKNKGGKDKKKKGGMFGGKETLCTHWYDLIDQWCL